MKSHYFPHDANAHENIAIIELRMHFGWEAYGIFWAILEILRTEDNYQTAYNANILAYKLHIDNKKLDQILKKCIELDILQTDKKMLFCNELSERMKRLESKSINARKAAEKRWGNANAMQMHSNSNAIKENKSKLNKSKVNNNKGCLFKNDPLYKFENFSKTFLGSKYENADLEFYFESVKNWADSKDVLKKDWAATARNFMLRDLKEDKLKLKDGIRKITEDEQQYQQFLQS